MIRILGLYITHILYMGIISEIIKTLDDLSFWNLLKVRCDWLGWDQHNYQCNLLV